MVRQNCDYVMLQPIYNKTQRDILWDMEAAFMDRNDFSTLMDDVIHRELLQGNTAEAPRKKVRIMVCADFEDSSDPTEKFFHWTPVPIDQLPPFRLCHPKYWEKSANQETSFAKSAETPQIVEIEGAKTALKKVAQ